MVTVFVSQLGLLDLDYELITFLKYQHPFSCFQLAWSDEGTILAERSGSGIVLSKGNMGL
jgi:hypothetical protein